MRCLNCGQKTGGIDSCEWCGYPLLEGSQTRRLKAEKLAAKEEAKRKAIETRQVKLAEKLAQQEAKRKAREKAKRKARQAIKARQEREARQARNEAKIASQIKGLEQLKKTVAAGKQGREGVEGSATAVERKSRVKENALELKLTPEIDRKKCLEVYPVNEPYAYIAIEASQPPTYQVCEVGLTRGEEELIKELKLRLFEIINVDLPSVDKPEDFLKQKTLEITKDLGIGLSSLSAFID